MTPSNRRVGPAQLPPVDQGEEGVAGLGEAPPKTQSRVVAIARTGFGIAMVVGASLAAAWLAHRHVTTSQRFAVSSVQVIGSERRLAEAIVAESGVAIGVNVFGVDLDSVRGRVLADPWISDAVLTRRLPGTIVIHVTERVPVALAAIGDLFLVAGDGAPFKRLEVGDPVELPVITGLTQESVNDDRSGAWRTIRRGIDVASEYTQTALARRAPLQEVHVDPSGGFTLVVGRPSIELVLGGPPFRRKLDEASRVVAELERRRAQAAAIMLDNQARPERVVARLREITARNQ